MKKKDTLYQLRESMVQIVSVYYYFFCDLNQSERCMYIYIYIYISLALRVLLFLNRVFLEIQTTATPSWLFALVFFVVYPALFIALFFASFSSFECCNCAARISSSPSKSAEGRYKA